MKELEYILSERELPLVHSYVEQFVNYHTVYYNNELVDSGVGTKTNRYAWVEIVGELTYAAIVAAIVNARYMQDEVTAIILNLLNTDAEPEKYAEYQQEAEELRQWRMVAKRVAKEVLEYLR